jgi:hypothetical protein
LTLPRFFTREGLLEELGSKTARGDRRTGSTMYRLRFETDDGVNAVVGDPWQENVESESIRVSESSEGRIESRGGLPSTGWLGTGGPDTVELLMWNNSVEMTVQTMRSSIHIEQRRPRI